MFNWIDQSILYTLSTWRTPNLVHLFLVITQLGSWITVLTVVLSTSFALWLKKEWHYIVPFWITVAGSGMVMSLAKVLFQRPRPTAAVYVESTMSFPSGHATIAIALWGFLTYLAVHHATKRWHKILLGCCGLTLILAIGFSRLYLGVHFFTDVLGGYLLGLLWLMIGIRLGHYSHHTHKVN